MNNKSSIPLLAFLSFSLSLLAFTNAKIIQVKGKINCDGKALSAIMVTDGVSMVETDKNGQYVLYTNSERDFVYYSLPSGYDSPIIDGIPVFYSVINKQKQKQQIDFKLTRSKQSQIKHAFIVAGDPQVVDNEDCEKLKLVVSDIEKTASNIGVDMPVHAISMGDNVFDKQELNDTYKQIIAKTKIPFYQVIGNHDMDYNERSDEMSAKSYTSKFGPTHYSFNIGKIHYIVLKDVFYYGNTYKYIGYISETQLSWLEKDLTKVTPGSTVICSLHIPTVYGEAEYTDNYGTLMSNSVMNRLALYKILAPYNTHILAGHSHTQWNTIVSSNIFEHTHSAVCAAWWQGEIGTDGTPKGYSIYKVDGDSLSWFFKAVGMLKDEQFKLYPKGSDPLHADCFIANVYNYDPSWTVKWYENGLPMGEMEQYWGEDPLAKLTYPPRSNKKYKWLSIGNTHHLFKATITNPSAKISVKVTDRFGNAYEKSL